MALSVQRVVFLSLLLDLFAFTIPLPLFPRLIQWYISREDGAESGLTSRTLRAVDAVRGRVLGGSLDRSTKRRWDIVLLGGLMGSIFSALQCVISPYLGRLSDRFGRKRVLLATMVGNTLSAIVWIQSTTFESFLLSRAIGGISEGNVQLSIAIISDVTSPETRSRDLSLVGIAFAICFCVGPPLGAWFTNHPLPITILGDYELNVYATPAILTLVLLSLEVILLVVALPETRRVGKTDVASEVKAQKAPAHERLAALSRLGRTHFLFLALFSGVEFTLTFLSFDLFDWDNAQNGRLLMTIGIISTILQGGYVRRVKAAESLLARRGVATCAIATVIMATLPSLAYVNKLRAATSLLYVAAAFLAFTSATVVNNLNALASMQCDDAVEGEEGKDTHPELAKGRALGKFRSSGQLGRALGPILACAAYWTVGPTTTYATSALAMIGLYTSMLHAIPTGTGSMKKL
ncbi:hypothetical protein FRB94_000034 [Tulasnella sp. JGI-2019a]|nr:hypothetical protein FRB94_000034 [Tulasnella sp. JGI-2019a]KAG9015721.1 hypothetical protein FRB93_012285 [Tulasnella sp. JGI-2019a]